MFAVDVVRPEDHVVEPEHLVRRLEIHLDGVAWRCRTGPRAAARMSSRIGTGPAPYTAIDDVNTKHSVPWLTAALIRLIEPIDVVRVVEAANEVAEPLGGVRREMIDVVEAMLIEELVDEGYVEDRAFDEYARLWERSRRFRH